MASALQQPSKSLSDRTSIQRAPRNDCEFGSAVREELDELSDRVAVALRHADDLGRSAPGMCSTDMQRDVLHLQARIAGIGRQIDDARETLERMRRRAASDQSTGEAVGESETTRLIYGPSGETVVEIASVRIMRS